MSGIISKDAIPVVIFTASIFENNVLSPGPCLVSESIEYQDLEAFLLDNAKISEITPLEYVQFFIGENSGISISFNFSINSSFG